MKFAWPWETKRLAEHHWVTRPWQPHRDRRVRAAVWLVFGGTIVAAVWHLQGAESSMLARGAVTILATLLLVWCWRAFDDRVRL